MIVDLGYAKIKYEEVPEKRVMIVCKCPFCEHKIKGSAHSQVDWNMILHIRQKHPDDEEAQILRKQLEEHNEKKK